VPVKAKQMANWLALSLCVLFVVLGSLWIWRPGIQTDEALFASGVYSPFYFPASSIRIFKRDVAVMVMSYVGALKGHLWTPIFALWGTTPATIRFPALVVGAISVWWFYRLLLRTLGVRAAIIGCALLATDAVYLLTTRWDWGPVAIQHALLVGGLLGIVTWWQNRRLIWLALGFFAFGLALWDKAIFAWSLVGLGIATLVVFPRELLRSLSVRTVATAVAAFAIGAFPLIRYNVRHEMITFRSNTVWTTRDVEDKFRLLGYTLEGSVLFGAIMRDSWEKPMREPESALERAVVGLSLRTRMQTESLQGWALAIALMLLPFIWRTPARKAVLFALVFSLVTFAQMALIENAGGGAHHTILLWPMPQFIIAAGFAYSSSRIPRGAAIAAVAVVAICLSNMLLLSTYYTNLIRNGAVVAWTDAIYPAVDALRRNNTERVCTTDWGFYDNIRSMVQNRIFMCVAEDPITEETKKYALAQISDPKTVFIAHTPGNEIEEGRVPLIEKFAAIHGYRKVSLGVFADGNGRPTIQIFTFRVLSGS
jgi:hypothetical protein